MTDQALEQVDSLGGEHAEDFAPAMQWLVEHPAEARPALHALLRERQEGMATRRALETLGRIGHPADVAVLDEQLLAGPEALAGDAATGLALHPDPAARDALVAAATSGVLAVAEAAVTGLEKRRDPAARAALERLLEDERPTIRHRAERALRALEADH